MDMENNMPDENIKSALDNTEPGTGTSGAPEPSAPADAAASSAGASNGRPTEQVPYTQPSGGVPYTQPSSSVPYTQPSGTAPYTQPAGYDGAAGGASYGQPSGSPYGGYDGTEPLDDGFDDEEDVPKKGHLGIVIYLLVLIAGAAAAIFYVRSTGFELPGVDRFFSFETQDTVSQDANGTEAESETANQVWNMDVDSDINQLVRSYYIALQSSDIVKLDELTDASVTIDQANVEAAAKYIDGYQNIRCYVAPGSTKDENGLYVAYDIKFKNISTTAPGLVPAYVRRDANGAPRLIPYENFDEAITAYMTATSAQPEIASLRSSVTAKYDEALAADPVLAKFVEDLSNGVINVPDAQTAVVPSGESVPEGESAAESVPASEDAFAEEVASIAAAAINGGSDAQDGSAEPSGELAPAAEGAMNPADAIQVVDGISFTPATAEMWTFDYLRVRSSPRTDVEDNIVTTLAPRAKVFVVGISDTWDMIMMEDGSGPYFAYKEYLSEDQNHPTTASSR
jgi:hypothetical protein